VNLTRRNKLFLLLSGFFITNAILGELIGSKLIQIGPFGMSMGVLPWPIVLIATDLINEYFGRDGVKKLTFVTVGLIIYAFAILFLAMQVPAASFSPVTSEQFNAVFGQSLWIIVGSIIAFMISQLVDVGVFWFFRNKTKGKYLWLRASGSTAISQLFDSVVIMGIAFWLPGKIKTSEFVNVALTNYSYKFLLAVAATPLIYLAHHFVDKYLAGEAGGGEKA
jgi:queuosine precursor transporter